MSTAEVQTLRNDIARIEASQKVMESTQQEILNLLQDRPAYNIQGLVSTVKKNSEDILSMKQQNRIREIKIATVTSAVTAPITVLIVKLITWLLKIN